MTDKIKFKNTINKKNSVKWVFIIIVWTFVLSIIINGVSSALMPNADIITAFFILIALVFVGIIFDMIGIAVATANEVTFNSMAAKNVRAATQAIRLVKSSEKVANFCNDVVGDIAGIISGSAAALIVTKISSGGAKATILSLIITASVAALTVGGKALGKSIGMRRANSIIYKVALVVYFKDIIFHKNRKRN